MKYPAVFASVLCFLMISVVHADSVPKSIPLLESKADAYILVEEAEREARRKERPANALEFSINSELRVERAQGDLVLRRTGVPQALGSRRNVEEEWVSPHLLFDLRPVHEWRAAVEWADALHSRSRWLFSKPRQYPN